MDPTRPTGVSVVIVTYGRRAELLAKVLAALARQDRLPERVVLVDNGTAPGSLEDAVKALGTIPCERIRFAQNLGSAAGFRAGIERAAGVPGLVWILDDDNEPAADALELLLRAREARGADPRELFASVRPGKVRDAGGAFLPLGSYPENAFLGVRLGRRHGRRPAPNTELVETPVSKFGGLLFDASWVDAVGLPDDSFFYAQEDGDYTSRITSAGGRIFLVLASHVHDLDEGGASTSARGFRLYYPTRNLVVVERRHRVSNRLTYSLNVLAGLALHLGRPLLRGDLDRARTIWEAVRDGWRGRLGMNPKYVPGGGP